MMSSQQVLPVEDVMAVQEFLEQAQNMMMSSEGEETSEDLEEKVKRLEVRCMEGYYLWVGGGVPFMAEVPFIDSI